MPWDPAPATTACQPSGSAARAEGRDLQVAVAEFCACAPCLLRKIAPQSVRLVCRWDDGDKRSIHRTGRHTKLWHARETSNRGRSMGSYSPYCVEVEFCELRVDGVLGSSAYMVGYGRRVPALLFALHRSL